MDYGFHPPTMSWPKKGVLMVEPTESESKEELDRFINSLIKIREEIRNNEDILKNSPHPQSLLLKDWEFNYTMREAFFPLEGMENNKYWPTIGRVNDIL